MEASAGREDSPDWMRNFQVPEAPPSSDSDPYALDDVTVDIGGQLGMPDKRKENAGQPSGEGLKGKAGGGAKSGSQMNEGFSKIVSRGPPEADEGDGLHTMQSVGKDSGKKAAGDVKERRNSRGKKSSSAANGTGNKDPESSRKISRGKAKEKPIEAGLINLDSDEELPPLATQQSAANTKAVPFEATENADGNDAQNRETNLDKTGTESLELKNCQVNMQTETVDLDPYQVADDVDIDTANRLTMSPAARLGLRRTSGNLELSEGGKESQKSNITSAGRYQSVSKGVSLEGLGKRRDGPATKEDGLKGSSLGEENVKDEDVPTEEGRKKEKRKAEEESENGLAKRKTRKRPRKSYKEDSGSDKNESTSTAEDDGQQTEQRKLKGKAKVRDTSEELEVAREAAEAVDEKEDFGSRKPRKSGGPNLDGVEKVVSPSKRRRSVDEVPTQATAVPTQEVGPERKGKLRAASSLPLVLPDKIHRNKVLVECEGEGENALDLSGDVGAVGRFSVLKKPGSEGNSMFLDLKGVMYQANIVPSTTFMVLNLGPTEAKVEAIMNDFVQLQEETNVFQTETTIEGTLDDFDFGEGANDERPGRAAEQEGTAGEGQEGEKKSKAPTKKGPKKREADAVAKPKRGSIAKKKPAKSGARAKSKPKAPAKPRKPRKAPAEKATKTKKK